MTIPAQTSALASAAVTYFHVLTTQGQPLSVQDGILAVSATLDPAHAVIAMLPASLPYICVLVAPDGRAFRVAADADDGIAASAMLVRSEVRVAVLLRYPLGMSFMVADGGKIRFDGSGQTQNAVFVLRALGTHQMPAAAHALGTEVGVVAAVRGRADMLLTAVRNSTCRPALAARMLRVLPRDELSELGRLLLANAADRALMQRLLPGDIWAETLLPALATWNQARPLGEGVPLQSSAEYATALLQGPHARKLVSTGLAIQSQARRAVAPRRCACVLACARNEGAYLLDWISYHLSVGFEHIFLYTNENDDGSDEMLELLARQGAVTWIRNRCRPDTSPQLKGYAHALRMLPQILDYAWVAAVDIDEYIGFEPARYSNVTDFLSQIDLQSTDAVALCWLLHGARPEDRWSPRSTPARFPLRETNPNKHVKSIFRPRHFWSALPHNPIPSLGAPFVFRAPDGGLHHHEGLHDRDASFSGSPTAECAWISHYMLRSAEEALWKWARGLGNRAPNDPVHKYPLETIARTFLNLARLEYLVEEKRITACARGQAEVLDSLMALPGVAACDAAIKAQFGARLAANTRLFLDTPLPENPSRTVVAFRALVQNLHA